MLTFIVHKVYEKSEAQAPRLVGIETDVLYEGVLYEGFTGPIVSELFKLKTKVNILVNNSRITTEAVLGRTQLKKVAQTLMGNIQSPIMIVNNLIETGMLQPQSRIINISSLRAADTDGKPGR